MARPRIIVAGATTAITRRTLERKLLWTPSAPCVHQGYLYALALAQHRHGVLLHHGQLMPTHEHLQVTPTQDNLPEFLRDLHRDAARYLQELLLAQGYDAPQGIWDKRQTHCMRLLDAGAQLAWIQYQHRNCVEAGLVDAVRHYPGWASSLAQLQGATLLIQRPDLYFSPQRPEQIELTFSPVPDLVRAFGRDQRPLIYWLEKEHRRWESAKRAERKASGSRVLGARPLKGIHPFAEPATPREPRGQLRPTFKLGPLLDHRAFEGLSRQEVLKLCCDEKRSFERDHQESLESCRAGKRDALFAAGTYEMAKRHNASAQEPTPHASSPSEPAPSAPQGARPHPAEPSRSPGGVRGPATARARTPAFETRRRTPSRPLDTDKARHAAAGHPQALPKLPQAGAEQPPNT